LAIPAVLVFEPFTTCQRMLGASLTAKLALLAGKTRHHAARPRLSIVRKSPTRSRCKPVDARFCCCCSDFLVWQGLVPFTLRTGGTMPLFALSKLLLLLGTRLHISRCSRICPRPDPELLLMPAVHLLQLKRALLAVTWTVWRRLRFAT